MTREDKKEMIIEAAKKLFMQYGPHKVTLDDIARGCDLVAASLYYYFPSKSELLREVVLREHRLFWDELTGRINAVTGAEAKLLELSRVMFEKMRDLIRLPGMTRSERRLVESDVEQDARKLKEDIVRLIEDILREGRAEGVFEFERPKLAARMFAAGLRGLFESVLDGEIPEDDLAGLESMCALMIRALKKSG